MHADAVAEMTITSLEDYQALRARIYEIMWAFLQQMH